MSQLSFFVPGFPATQGGMRPVTTKNGRTALISTGSDGFERWRKKVTNQCMAAMFAQRPAKITGPARVVLRFYLPMPTSRLAAVRRAGIGPSTVKPDVDKLTRAVNDSLTAAGALGDDALITLQMVAKCEVLDQSLCGVAVTVDVDDTDLDAVYARRLAMPARLSQVDVVERDVRRARARQPHR